VLIAAAELKIRTRSLDSALEGAIDAQVIIELAAWGLVMAWVVSATLRLKGHRNALSFRHLGPALKALIVVSVIVFVSSLYAPSVRSIVKGAEFAGLTALTVFAYHTLRNEAMDATTEFWLWTRRSVWIMTGAALALTLLLFFPISSLFASLTQTQLRFQIMEAHPIASAGILSLALLMVAGSYFSLFDPWLDHRRRGVVLGSAALVVLVLITATKARGALLGLVGGVGVLTMTTASLRKRRVGLVLVFLLLMLPLLGIGDQALTRTLIRNQSIEQLTSLSDRTLLFEAAWPLVLQQPFFGHGFLAAASSFPDLFPWAGEGHNVFLESAYSFGLVGTLAFVVLLIQIGRQLGGALRSRVPAEKHLANEMAAVGVFILMLSVVGDSFAGIPGFETISLMWLALMSDLLRRNRVRTPLQLRGRH